MTNSGLVTPHSRPGTPSDLLSPSSNPQRLQSNSSTLMNSSNPALYTSALQNAPSASSSNNATSAFASLSKHSSHANSSVSLGGTFHKQSSSSSSVPSFEREIYDQLFSMYKTLLSLKNNRAKYISSKQIYEIYDQFLNTINELKLTRKDEELKGITLQIPNGNDLIIDDNFQLLSLCFVTCGLIKFAPATYSSLSTVMKLLTHLKECKVYTMDDLKPVGTRLEEIRDIIVTSQDKFEDEDEEMKDGRALLSHQIEETLLRNKLNRCEGLYTELVDNFKNVPLDLEPTYHELINIRQQILDLLTDYQDIGSSERQQELNDKISGLKQDLKQVENLRDEGDGKFHSSEVLDEKQLDSIQPVINGLIDDCKNLLADLQMHDEELSLANLSIEDDGEGKEGSLIELKQQYDLIYKQLQELKLTLENLLITRRWTLRETDLYNYQKSLKSIDEQRMKLVQQTPKGKLRKYQLLVLYLLRRCYSVIYKLLESSEPVSESLTPIHNQLSTVKRCLLELKRVDGVNNLRELYPFQFKLASIDNLRKDGKFIVDTTVPEGQGALCALLSECFDILQEMKIEAEEKEIEEVGDDAIDYDDDDAVFGERMANGGGFTNSVEGGVDGSASILNGPDDVEVKRNRFKEFNEADYDLDSISNYDEDSDAYDISDSEYEGNDYY